MRLQGDFYEILNSEATTDGFAMLVRLNPAHFIYDAHFPGHPMTPGVCLVKMAVELTEEQLGERLQLQVAPNIRFRKAIGNEGVLVFRFAKVCEDELAVSANVCVEDEAGRNCATMKVKMKK